MLKTDIDYPDYLPYPIRAGYSTKAEDPFIRTQLSSGRARQMQRFSSVPSTYNVNFMFENEPQAMLFEGWFKHSLKSGSKWFNAKLKTPLGVGRYVCRFKEMYSGPDPIGSCAWEVSATLELWEQPVLSSEWVDFPEFILDANLLDIALNKDWPK